MLLNRSCFSGMIFLLSSRRVFIFTSPVAPVPFSQANERIDVYFEYRRSLCQRAAFFCIFCHTSCEDCIGFLVVFQSKSIELHGTQFLPFYRCHLIITNCLEIQVNPHYTQAMSYDRDLRLRALEYAKEGHSLTQTAAVFKVNISTIIAWKRRYEATGDVKIKVRCPVNKKIIPEKHDLFDNIEQGYEF